MIDLSSQYDSSLDRDAEDQQEQDSEDEKAVRSCRPVLR